jgi:zinc finger-containing ubiquitin peptidase 1
MPARIANIISDEGDENAVTGITHRLVVLLKKDPDVETAYTCTRHAVQIHKLSNEGADFCGYRNIQMLCSAVGLSEVQTGCAVDLRKKLSIPLLQDLIEQAWDRDINPHGRIQTGGIKGTRKYVGTSEVWIISRIPVT